MTAKEWLSRARTIDGELAALLEAREKLEARLTKATQTLTGDTVQSTKDPHKFDELGDLALQIQEALRTCCRIKTETQTVINRIENGVFRELLIRRYMNGETFEQIAVAMHYSWRQVHRVHGRALIAVAEVLKCQM